MNNTIKAYDFNMPTNPNIIEEDLEQEEKAMYSPYTLNRTNIETLKVKKIKSKFNFLKAHDGLQEGHVHVLLGRTNKGKSALILEIILENALNGVSSLLFLSEGKRDDIRNQLDNLLKLKRIQISKHDDIREMIHIITEQNLTSSTGLETPTKWINALLSIRRDIGVELLFIDNISGIYFGNAFPEIQVDFIKYLNDSTQREGISTVIAVHQAKSVTPDKELDIQDVRANQAFTIIPSYVYALNDFNNLDKTKRVIKILKSRNHGSAISKYFELTYSVSGKLGHYTKDVELPELTARRDFVTNKRLVPTYKKQA